MLRNIKYQAHARFIYCCVLFFIFSLLIFSETDLEQKESQLAQIQGEKRLKILEELVVLLLETDAQKALQHGREALTLLEKFSSPQREMVLLNHLSAACVRLGDFKGAKEYTEKALSIARNLSQERQRILLYSFIIIAVLILLLVVVIYNTFRLKSKAHRSLAGEIREHQQTARKLRESEEKSGILAEKSILAERAQEELLKSQKLETIGILAGGIGHEFNNLLSVIVGNVAMAKEEAAGKQPLTKMLDSAEKASDKSAELVKKLMELSRTGWILTQKLELTKILEETLDYYQELNPNDYTVSIPPGLKSMRGDKRQLRQVLYNLLKNAEASTTEPKEIIIAAQNIIMDPDNIFTLPAGDYVKISITDNGAGIPGFCQGSSFDPYFSIKNTFSKEGIGLSLALCYSIIKKHKGYIDIQSEADKGTTVEIYLPACS